MDRLLLRMFEFEARVPRPLRPAFRGAVFVFGLGLGWGGKLFFAGLLTVLILLVGPLHGARVFLGTLGIAMAAGAGAGVVATLLEPLGRFGRGGEWGRWAISILAFLIIASLLAPAFPLSLPDPAFYWLAGAVAALGATGLVWTDDRGPHRLPPHQFRLVRSLTALRIAPDRFLAAAEERLREYERRCRALEAEIPRRPSAARDRDRLLSAMRADMADVGERLRRFHRLTGLDPDGVSVAQDRLARIETRSAMVAPRRPEGPATV